MAFRELAGGIGFTEGPLWTGDGAVLVTSMSRGLLYRVELAGGADPRVETGGGPNGLAAAPDGSIYIAQNAGFRSRSERAVVPGLQRLVGDDVTDLPDPDGVAPNDLVVGRDGAVWFTDPGRDEARGLGPRVRRWVPGTNIIESVADDLELPNGLAFSADGSLLYVADSLAHEIVRYPVDGGALGAAERWAKVPDAGPDGIAFDADGLLYIASFDLDEVTVLDPDGAVVRRMPTGEGSHPSNLCFAGDDLESLVVTVVSGGRVVVADETFRGLAL